MGADFLFATIPKFEWNEQREELFKQSLQEESVADLLSFAADFALDAHIQALDETHPEEHTEESWKEYQAQLVREYLLAALRDVSKSDDRRDVDELRLYEMPYTCLITGGMSWGDSPTDIFDQFLHINEFSTLYERCLMFAKEDYQACTTT